MGSFSKENECMNIPCKIEELKEKDIEVIVNKALKEGNPAYPVPKIMKHEEMEKVIKEILV